MGKNDDRIYLQHIISSINKVGGYVMGVIYEDYLANDLLIDAVIRNLEIIGEASNNLSEEFKENHPELNFRPAISMRNQLAHGYDDVDLEIVWNTINEDLPRLKDQLVNLI